jgi:hypothetical protein
VRAVNGAVGNITMYIKVFGLVKSIDEFIREFKGRHVGNICRFNGVKEDDSTINSLS